MGKYNSIVIGAGIAGAVVARELAEQGNKKVLVLEMREHLGGNCFDEYDQNGVLIHKYGPHIFHTSKEKVYDYLSRFTDWNLFEHKVVAKVDDELIPVPFNINSLHKAFDEKKAKRLEEKLVKEFTEGARVPILTLRNHEDDEIKEIGDFIYEKVFLFYTMKQWGQKPEEIHPSVTARVPIVISRDNRYFPDKYQGMPSPSYTRMFERMFSHSNITVNLESDGREEIAFREDGIYFQGEKFEGDVIYTGPLDELFDCQYGRLPYRSLDFAFENHKIGDYQGHSVVNYTMSEEYTRITEFKHLSGQSTDSTTIVKEYPKAYVGDGTDIPYYSIENLENREKYNKYLADIAVYNNFYLLGRLAEYKYYNIDAMVEQALVLSEKLLEN